MKFECDCKDVDEVAMPPRTELADGYRSAHQGKSFNGLPMRRFTRVRWRSRSD
ncbi:MAG: hypothetical protein ACI3ZO_01165 [Candidatus Cryptobacteroides sp.]